MLAVRWHGPRDVRVEEVEEPGPPGPGMVALAVSLCGICGTDLAEYLHGPVLIRDRPHPLSGQRPPVVLGHELVGTVEAVGPGVEGVRLGQRVVVDACWRCGRCWFCVRGDYHLCPQGGSVGLHSDGGLAPRVQVPAYTLVPLPEGVPDPEAALTEPLAVAVHACDQGGIGLGETAAVVGFGPVGACVALCARAAGARVVVLEPLAGRREVAARLGFEEVLDPSDADPRREVRRRTGGLGADVAFDCTGNPELLPSSLELTRRGGTLVVAGLGKAPGRLDPNRLVLFERRVVGSLGYRHDLPRALELLAWGRVRARELVTGTVPLEEAVREGFEALARDPGRHLKVQVRCS
ncbi:MAG TPA: 2,3-butanediol dehydrogenase [Actinomycetota bacterium]|nr:2,3-butanediol dehydrogenase [Actinomycetota bacterium]